MLKYEYWIQDYFGVHVQLEVSCPTKSYTTPQVFLCENVSEEAFRVDEEVINDLEYSAEGMTVAILSQIIEQAEEQQWEEYEELRSELDLEDSGKASVFPLVDLDYGRPTDHPGEATTKADEDGAEAEAEVYKAEMVKREKGSISKEESSNGEDSYCIWPQNKRSREPIHRAMSELNR